MTTRQFDHDPRAVTKARNAADLTKSALARRIGCARSLITEIENGTRNATPDMIAKLAHFLDCPAADLQRKATDEPRGQAEAAGAVDVRDLRDGQ